MPSSEAAIHCRATLSSESTHSASMSQFTTNSTLRLLLLPAVLTELLSEKTKVAGHTVVWGHPYITHLECCPDHQSTVGLYRQLILFYTCLDIKTHRAKPLHIVKQYVQLHKIQISWAFALRSLLECKSLNKDELCVETLLEPFSVIDDHPYFREENHLYSSTSIWEINYRPSTYCTLSHSRPLGELRDV